ncbi:hypothetical protein [Afipia clevelandensis]|uniref:SIR2-like domain-containing protein n=1 Tax=Afipia clevelandensis ATCC 49720 TaxID=883079 RepID=K8PPX8_9BRAD|nr:hypothetical protein [Afipia clevelandensis]EKS40403.1 hypothetical protein HMPREF9696_00854 [Afipia clevelandensis ATCC 49720]
MAKSKVIVAKKIVQRTIILGAGASVPYSLPLAWELMAQSAETIKALIRRYHEGAEGYFRVTDQYLAQGSDLNFALLKSIGDLDDFLSTAEIFRNHLVALNLDDFVRDHPSMTGVVSMLITIALFRAMYRNDNGIWRLKSQFEQGALAPEKDWMRSLVGIMRPIASPENRLAIISFNYDGLLERSMRMYWNGAERRYWPMDECVEFVYPHGCITSLPEQVHPVRRYLESQATNIRVGDNKDDEARTRAKRLILASSKIYMVGFSLSTNNQELLGLGREKMASGFFVQNFQTKDKRLVRILDEAGVPPNCRDDGDMDSLIRHGFFEQ